MLFRDIRLPKLVIDRWHGPLATLLNNSFTLDLHPVEGNCLVVDLTISWQRGSKKKMLKSPSVWHQHHNSKTYIWLDRNKNQLRHKATFILTSNVILTSLSMWRKSTHVVRILRSLHAIWKVMSAKLLEDHQISGGFKHSIDSNVKPSVHLNC